MKSIYPFKLKLEILTVFFFLTLNASFAQLGINTNTPHPSSVLELKDNERGLLIPRLSTDARNRMTSSTNPFKPAHSLLVFDTTQNMFYFYDAKHEYVPYWVALNPWQGYSKTDDVRLRTTGNVGIGVSYKMREKLEVGGNIRVRDTVKARALSAIRINGTHLTVTNVNSANVNTNKINSSTGTVVSDGTISAQKFTGDGIIPKGGIIMWHGDPNQVPEGWQLCNGEKGSPDLSNKFILSYGGESGNVNSQGGSHNVTLKKENLPPHTHSYGDHSQSDAAQGKDLAGSGYSFMLGQYLRDGSTGDSSSELKSTPIDNRPQYWVLAFIMKL